MREWLGEWLGSGWGSEGVAGGVVREWLGSEGVAGGVAGGGAFDILEELQCRVVICPRSN